MSELFYTILNMSISASILILVVLLLRLIFRKAPKWVTVLLWGLVAVRLICPFALETPFSLMPKTEWITEEPAYNEENQYFDSVAPDRIPVDAIGDSAIGKDITVHYYTVEPHIEINRGVNPVFVLNCIWLAGIAAMLVYMLVSYICVYRRIRGAEQFKDNIYTSESVSSPFVFGLIRPRIYLPENMDAVSMSYVIAHEEAHLRRLDHLWKPFGFLLLAVHWFNPMIWIGYILLCRDIEMACDERVVRGMNDEERVDYSEALLECSVSRKMITACPLAFGEVGAKERIKTVLNYRKPAFWIVVMALVACVVAAVCFLTNPITIRNPWVQEYIVGAEGILGQVDKEKYESVHEDFAIGADKYGRAVFKDPFKAFDTMKELYSDGLELIREEQELAPISQNNYNLYKKFGWQVTSGSEEAQKQASFISGFLDIYENSFTKDKPNTDLPAPTVEEKKSLTLDDVITLSAKGYDLTWDDFSRYSSVETGSGLYIRVYEIDETFEVWIGGGSPVSDPMYIYLTLAGDLETRIDIRDGGVEEFINDINKLHPKNTISDLAIDMPLDLEANPGVGCEIDFENEDFIIFHGDFGLFAYDLNDRRILFTIDFVKAIGIDGSVQGSHGTAVEVSKEADTILISECDAETDIRGKVCRIDLISGTYSIVEYNELPNTFNKDDVRGYVYPGVKRNQMTYILGDNTWSIFELNSEYVTETEAKDIAVNEAKHTFDEIIAYFDYNKYVWCVGLWESNAKLPAQIVYIDTTGNYIGSSFAE